MKQLVNDTLLFIGHSERNLRYTIKLNTLEACNGDSSLLLLVWMNLISNAIKYSGKSAEPIIEIGCVKNTEDVTYYIKDNGVGFDMKKADKLFKAFYRMHSRTDFEGTGLGLSIVERIITRHGGKIWAEAEIGKGATFYFNLPAA